MAVKPIPDGYHTVTPFLLVKDASKVIEFLKQAFGAVESSRHTQPDGSVMHAELRIGDSNLMLAEANDKWPAMPSMLYLYVQDVDSVYKKAVQAGGKSLREPTNEFYGDRSAGVMDASNNQWWIATHIEDVTPQEMLQRQEKWAKEAAQKQGS